MSNTDVLKKLLRDYWGYERFRPLQEEAMAAVMAGEDSLVILPTGGGKSLCFQAPALALEGTAIVVSPLISLMKDQVDALRDIGVAAGKLHSGQPQDEAIEVGYQLREGSLKLLYVSPERLVMGGFSGVARGAKISFLAVDEAHCVSEWGHDFRPEYRQLSGFREAFPKIPIHGYTATATPNVARDIAKQLGQRRPRLLTGSFDRPNLLYRVDQRTDVVDQVCRVAERHKGESGIVYCISRKDTEALAKDLNGRKIKAVAYHAGLSDELRARNQDKFINDEVQVVVATVAFGMGIDKPDVRFVIHAGMPKSIEGYQQESGRAGRDGLEAECLLLYSGQDIVKWNFIVKDLVADQAKATKQKLRAVEGYCTGWECRRKSLLGYFGEAYEEENCARCDVCAGILAPLEDSLVVAQKILSCVKRMKEERGIFHTVAVLVGGEDDAVMQAGHHALTTFGLLRQYDRVAVRSWIAQLIAAGTLEREGHGADAPLRVTPKGWEVLRGNETPKLLHRDPKREEAATRRGGGGEDEWGGVDRDLFEVLRQLRSAIAKEKQVPPYIVFGDKTLRDLARVRPTSIPSMGRIHGIGAAKLEAYGESFLSAIAAYRSTHPDLAMDVKSITAPTPVAPSAKKTVSRDGAHREAIELLRSGHSLYEVAEKTGRAPSTVEGYLAELVEEDRIADATRWVDAATIRRIEVAADADGSGKLKPISEALGGEVPYWKIRVTLICRRMRQK